MLISLCNTLTLLQEYVSKKNGSQSKGVQEEASIHQDNSDLTKSKKQLTTVLYAGKLL
jgi:hypothetical protein